MCANKSPHGLEHSVLNRNHLAFLRLIVRGKPPAVGEIFPNPGGVGAGKLPLDPFDEPSLRIELAARAGRREVGEKFDFLGFTHISGHDRRGKCMLRRLTRQDRMIAALKRIS